MTIPDDDYIVDIEGLNQPEEDDSSDSQATTGRKWVGIQFDCCQVYQRVYKNTAGTAYEGRCPGCQRLIVVRVGPDGTSARFFRAE